MREIIFRGKRTYDSQWITGWLVELGRQSFSDNRRFGIANKAVPLGTSSVCYNLKIDEVIPETVGQYTGLTDRNGKKIFEGDIVRTQPFSNKPYSSKAKYKQHIGVVEYRVRHFKNSLYEQDYEGKWIVKISDYGKFTYCNWNDFFKCEVIGNIYDNLELLPENNE